MDKSSGYNKIIILLIGAIVFLFVLFFLPMIEIKDSQARKVTCFFKEHYNDYTLEDCKDVLGEPVYVTDNERRYYFAGGKSYSVGFINRYKEYDFYVVLDERKEYVENIEYLCRMEISFGFFDLSFYRFIIKL